MASPLAAFLSQQVAQWNAQHPGRPLDPAAVLAVSGREGLSGGIGDNGHAFGPMQENDAGGVLTGRFPGESPAQLNAWAWSPAGVTDALSRVAGVAAGERGAQAVNDIVARFERPANPAAEISGADASLGVSPQHAAATATPPTSGSPAAPDARAALASFLIGNLSSHNRPTSEGLLGELQQLKPLELQAAAAAPVAPDAAALAPVPDALATRPGIAVDKSILPAVARITQGFGVKVNSGYRSAQHNADVGGAPGSDHLHGDAVDFTGSPEQMAALYQWAQGKFPYVEPWSQAKNHVHISFL